MASAASSGLTVSSDASGASAGASSAGASVSAAGAGSSTCSIVSEPPQAVTSMANRSEKTNVRSFMGSSEELRTGPLSCTVQPRVCSAVHGTGVASVTTSHDLPTPILKSHIARRKSRAKVLSLRSSPNWIEHLTTDQEVGGSSPSERATQIPRSGEGFRAFTQRACQTPVTAGFLAVRFWRASNFSADSISAGLIAMISSCACAASAFKPVMLAIFQ